MAPSQPLTRNDLSAAPISKAEAGPAVALALVDLSREHPASPTHSRLTPGLRFLSRALLPAGMPRVRLARWRAVAKAGRCAFFNGPATTGITAAYAELLRTGELQSAIPASLARALAGLALGAVFGLVLGLFAGLWRVGEELFDAPLQMLRTIPLIARRPPHTDRAHP